MPPRTDLTDDEVLRVMTECGFDAADEIDFRLTRHYLRHRVPTCCILCEVGLIRPLTTFLPDPDRAERLIRRNPDGGLKSDLGMAAVMLCAYRRRAYDEATDRWTNYTPCPACLLKKNFVWDVPDGCPCCQDEAEHPKAGPLPASDSAY